MKKLILFFSLLFVVLSCFADTVIEPGVHYNKRLGYASYIDYNKDFLVYACAADYKTCSPERRKQYIDYLLSEEGMKLWVSSLMKNYEKMDELFSFLYIDFFNATSDYVVMRALGISRKDNQGDASYSLYLYDSLGQAVDKIKIAEIEFDKLFEAVTSNEDIDIKRVWNDLKKKKGK